MRILCTGITGFAGSHLADYWIKMENVEVAGTKRTRSPMDNIKGIKDDIYLYDCDIEDSISVSSVIKDFKPDVIHHLAAMSYVPASWNYPKVTMETNILGTLNVLEAVRQYSPECVVQVAGSSEEYGEVYKDECPIREENPLRPLSPYGVSKVATDLLAQQYHKSYGIRTVITRAFNHEGPRRGEVFVTSNFARQIANIVNGIQEPTIKVGNLDSIRDFTHIYDMVRAYALSVTTPSIHYGEAYNICAGTHTTIREFLDILLEIAQIKVTII